MKVDPNEAREMPQFEDPLNVDADVIATDRRRRTIAAPREWSDRVIRDFSTRSRTDRRKSVRNDRLVFTLPCYKSAPRQQEATPLQDRRTKDEVNASAPRNQSPLKNEEPRMGWVQSGALEQDF
jgi:hypothetical protein